MPHTESALVHDGAACYVVRTPAGCEIRAHAGTHSVAIGTQPTAEAAIRTATRLDRHPAQVRRYIGA
jgi:hypothetical protein